MSQKSATPLVSQEVIALYDEYTHAPLERRVFMKRLTAITGSTAAAYTVLPLLENNVAQAQLVKGDDPRVAVERIGFQGATGEVRGYLVSPKAATGKLPAVIVIHENRGLNPHIEDVARRIALAGYLTLAIDYLSPLGGTPADEDRARDMIAKLDQAQVTANGQAAIQFLKTHARSTGKVGAVGFCWGGATTNRLAISGADLGAGVVYYGGAPANLADVPNLKAPMLFHYAGTDTNVNKTWPDYEAALKAANKKYEAYIYEGGIHAFNNDTSAARYNETIAKLAWQRTLDFFAKNLA
ncbi:dienelactone hydrolase family protein [Uliginosibacterium sp. H1]|uniref:dienelactone hydrolase family protein n=1 Tax=Uliginosibacterium sp. H1 TaxID=3114757 RepID=UPI002E1A0016|nr:dienelactone hydrolase family protein [Uliginosibacterium sp. H1]